jgi:type IV pilus assembly protein PilB
MQAIKDKASDIHFEPFENEFKMRYRIDGVLYEMVPPPKQLGPAITSRVKVMANLDIAERRLPQDGRIELDGGGKPVDLRSGGAAHDVGRERRDACARPKQR